MIVANAHNDGTNNHDAMHGIRCAHYLKKRKEKKKELLMVKDPQKSILWVLFVTNKNHVARHRNAVDCEQKTMANNHETRTKDRNAVADSEMINYQLF